MAAKVLVVPLLLNGSKTIQGHSPSAINVLNGHSGKQTSFMAYFRGLGWRNDHSSPSL